MIDLGGATRAEQVQRDVEHLRVVVAHEWLVNYGGSERVVEQMMTVVPRARLLTTLSRPERLPASLQHAETSALQRIPGAAANHEWLLPLMPLSWRLRTPLDGVDAVVSSSHACAKAVHARHDIPHLCYCHTPMRYAWDFSGERSRFPRGTRIGARALMAGFRRWDRRSAGRVTQFVANSTAVRSRIETVYRREARVIYPPVRTTFFTIDPAVGREGFFLYAGRLTGYKRPDLVVEAFRDSPFELVVVGDGPLRGALQSLALPNVRFLGHVTDEHLRDLYRRCRALVFVAEEDFGIAMAEAQACGAPIIALGRGGAKDIVVDDELGVLIRTQNPEDIRRAVEEISLSAYDHEHVARSAERFSEMRFRTEFADALVEMTA